MRLLEQLQQRKAEGKKAFAMLIDPDKVRLEHCAALGQRIDRAGIDYIFVGGSLLMNDNLHQTIPALKRHTDTPIILFPGSIYQISSDADAILFLSVISGRNPEMLIGNHVVAAPLIKQSGLEVMPTGYILVDTGRTTSVHYMSNTQPIPFEKSDIAVCTAMAGELLGMGLIYLDGGSGADQSISTEMISAVAGAIDIPLIVGGGIRTTAQAHSVLKAGADVIVIGNALEGDTEHPLIADIPELIATF